MMLRRFLYLAASILTIYSFNIPLSAGTETIKNSNPEILITLRKKIVKITAYKSDIIRITMSEKAGQNINPFSVIQKPEGYFTSVTDKKDTLFLSTEKLNIKISKSPFRIKFFLKDNRLINSDYSPIGTIRQGTKTTCHKKLFYDEKFIGLGEKTGPLNRRGRTYVNWNTDHYAYDINSDPLYASIPFFIGIHDSLVYGIFLDNTYKTRFDFGASTDNKFYSFSAANGDMDYYFFGAQSIKDIIRDYTWLTGRMEMVPRWILGYQQCRWSYYPDSEVLRIAKTFRQKRIPADVIYLDIHYMDGYKIFTWDKKRFPDPKKMISELNRLGFHVVTIVDPGIKIDPKYSAYNEGVKNRFFLTYPDSDFYTGSVWPGKCHFPDFTNPEAGSWWGNHFSALINPGVEGFWNDMNEPSVWGQSFPEIVKGRAGSMDKMHNVYGMLMTKATFEGTKKLLQNKRTFCLTRSAFAGIQRYSAVWTGDNVATEDHMMAGVLLVNSMGLSGIPFTGPDIGGFAGTPSKELFLRWLSIGVYTPFFRNHTEINSLHQEPWIFGERAESLSRRYINKRYELMPYIYSAFYEAVHTGMPVSRSLSILYPFDENIYDHRFQYQYLFGPFLLVCPEKSSQKTVDVYFPEGKWFRVDDETQTFTGPCTQKVKSDLPELPVFAKGGSIIPMQKIVQHTDETPGDTLFLHIYMGDVKTAFTFYDDDGKTLDYRKGKFYKRDMIFDPGNKIFLITKTTGKYRPVFKIIKLILHNFTNIDKVNINNRISTLARNKNSAVKSINIENISDEIRMKW
ncbi:DUF4968 domain-containing protein [bacterium]|nr:DUF4968 domain-containing protein [bacterium]